MPLIPADSTRHWPVRPGGPVMTGTVAAAGELSALAGEYPAWHVWQSDGGTWWATRLGVRNPPGNAPDGWAMTVSADGPRGLRKELTEQAALCSHPSDV